MFRNLAESPQRKNIISSLGLREIDVDLAKKLGERTASEVFEYLSKQQPDLVKLTDAFYEVRQRMVIPRIKESRMYDQELMSVLENNSKYVTFNVANYLLKRMEKYGANSTATKHLKKSAGTMSDIQNVLAATLEKDMLLLVEAKRHRTMKLTVDWLKENKSWLEKYKFNIRGKASLKEGAKERIIMKPKFVGEGKLEAPPKGMSPFHYMVDGKLQTYYVNSYIAKAFSANPLQQFYAMKQVTGSADIFRKLFTEYNPAFWPVNMGRDINRSVKLLPNARYFDLVGAGKNSYIKYLFKAIKPAYKSIFKDGTELTRWMEEEGFLISMVEGYRGQAGNKAIMKGLDPDTFMIEKLLKKEITKHGTLDKLYNRTFGELFNKLGNFARLFERTPKIAGTMYLKDMIKRGEIKMTDKELMLRIQSEVGSPNFLRQGHLHTITNNFWLYSNAFKEGWRADYNRFLEAPASVGTKFIAYNVTPKILQKSIELGLWGTALGFAVKYGISEWDRVNYIPIVVGMTEDGRPIYFRIPQDETSRLINGVLYKMMDTALDGDAKDLLRTPIDLMGYIGSSGVPSMNPIISMMADLISWFNGVTPWDDWAGTTAVDQTTDKAGGYAKQVEIVKWFFNTYSGTGFYKFKSNNMDEVQSELEKVLDLPIIGRPISRFIKIGDHPATNFVKEGPDGVDAYDKADANLTLNVRNGIFKLISGQPLNDKEKEALKTRQSWLTNAQTLDLLTKYAGGDEMIRDIISEKDGDRKKVKILKYIEYIQKTDQNINVETKKE